MSFRMLGLLIDVEAQKAIDRVMPARQTEQSPRDEQTPGRPTPNEPSGARMRPPRGDGR